MSWARQWRVSAVATFQIPDRDPSGAQLALGGNAVPCLQMNLLTVHQSSPPSFDRPTLSLRRAVFGVLKRENSVADWKHRSQTIDGWNESLWWYVLVARTLERLTPDVTEFASQHGDSQRFQGKKTPCVPFNHLVTSG